MVLPALPTLLGCFEALAVRQEVEFLGHLVPLALDVLAELVIDYG
jgi:hypothetical protein